MTSPSVFRLPHKVGAMKRTSLGKKSRWLCLAALVSVSGCFQASIVSAQSSLKGATEQPLPLEQREQINYDAYMLGLATASKLSSSICLS